MVVGRHALESSSLSALAYAQGDPQCEEKGSPEVSEEIELARVELFEAVAKVVGYVPFGFGDTMSFLMHPEIIDSTEAYLQAWRKATKE